MTTRTEGFRLVSLLIVIALCAIALFAGFHALATTPQARTEQSAIILDAAQSTVDASQSTLTTSAQPQQPVAPPVPEQTANASSQAEPPAPVYDAVVPEPAPEPAPKAPPAPVAVAPAPPVDIDDDGDDDYDNDDVDDDLDD